MRPSPFVIGALMLALAACTQPTPRTESPSVEASTPDQAGSEVGSGEMEADGPKAPADRPTAERKVTKSADGRATISEVDLGNAESGDFRAPVRGILVTPSVMETETPLIVVNHLRGPNCADGVVAFPCPNGEEGLRFDRGMTYLGESLAAQGYAVLIPDLSGIWVGSDVHKPYDQNAMWTDAVSKLVDAITTDANGTTTVYGINGADKITRDKIGLVVHSRSGTIVDPAIALFGAQAVRGVLAYAPFYDTVDAKSFTPAPADVPYLAISGEQDLDVGPSANLWLSEYLGKERTTPAMVATVPGLGHMLVNRTLTEAKIDDRTACDMMECPDAAEHERVLSTAAADWFATTIKATPGSVPLDGQKILPAQLAGLDARWLAHSNGTDVIRLHPEDFKADAGGTATVCRHADPMNPEPADDACPEPEQGVVQSASTINVLTAASAQTEATGVKTLALHLSPSGTFADQAGSGTPIRVTLTLASGEPSTVTLDPKDPALKDRKTNEDNGIYQVGTIRVALPEKVTAGTITKVTVHSDRHPIELRGVDLLK